jgi:hypothetical protein
MKTCKACGTKFEPLRSTQVVCSPACAIAWSKQGKGKQSAEKVLRAVTRERKAASAKRQKTTLKTTAAADALAAGGDEKLATKLRALQEKQLDAMGGIEGNWLVLGDMSGSMAGAIEVAKGVAAILARMVKGAVYLVFFDSSPRFFDVTGKSVEEIRTITRMIKPEGSTSIGCGLQYIREKKLLVDGIAIVTDGGENCTPYFATHNTQLCIWVFQKNHRPYIGKEIAKCINVLNPSKISYK